MTANSSGEASFGSLKITYSSPSPGISPAGGFIVSGGASFQDTLTVAGYTGPGFIQYHLTVENLFSSDLPISSLTLTSGAQSETDYEGTSHLHDLLSSLYPFTAGIPFELGVSIVEAAVGSAGDGLPLDAVMGATIDSISLFDSTGKAITGYSLLAASGTDYPAVGEVPEPSSLLLFVPCVVLAMWRIKRLSGSTP
jgi:hypothetical protein